MKYAIHAFLAYMCILFSPAVLANGPHGKDNNPTGKNTEVESKRLIKGYDDLAALYEDIRCKYDSGTPPLKAIEGLEERARKLENSTIPDKTPINLPPTVREQFSKGEISVITAGLEFRKSGPSDRTYLWAGDYFAQKSRAGASAPAALSKNLVDSVRRAFDGPISEKLENLLDKMERTKGVTKEEIEEQRRVNSNIQALFEDALDKAPHNFELALVDGKVRFNPTARFARLQARQAADLAGVSAALVGKEGPVVMPPFVDPVAWYLRFGESNSKEMISAAARLPEPRSRGKVEAWVNASLKVLMPKSEARNACKSGGFHVGIEVPPALGKTLHYNLLKNDLVKLNAQDPNSPIQLVPSVSDRLGLAKDGKTTAAALLARLNALSTGQDPFVGDEAIPLWAGVHGAVGDSRELMHQYRATRETFDTNSKFLAKTPVTISPAVAKALGVPKATTVPADQLDFAKALHPNTSGLSQAEYRGLGTAINAAVTARREAPPEFKTTATYFATKEKLNGVPDNTPVTLTAPSAKTLGVPESTTAGALRTKLEAIVGGDPFHGPDSAVRWNEIHAAIAAGTASTASFGKVQSYYTNHKAKLGTEPIQKLSPAVQTALGVKGDSIPANTLDLTKLAPSASRLSAAELEAFHGELVAALGRVTAREASMCGCGPSFSSGAPVCLIRTPAGRTAWTTRQGDCSTVCTNLLQPYANTHFANACAAGLRPL